jgi:hypothetical protein
MRPEFKSIFAATVAMIGLSACGTGATSYDKWAEATNKKISTGYTEMLFGKQSVEMDADVPKDAVINVAYRVGEGSGLPGRSTSVFYNKLAGDVTYPKSCKTSLSFKVALINNDNTLIQTESVFIPSYDGGIKALVNKDVLTDPSKSASSQVVKLRVKDFQCLPSTGVAQSAGEQTAAAKPMTDAEQFQALTPEQKAKVMGQPAPKKPAAKASKPAAK